LAPYYTLVADDGIDLSQKADFFASVQARFRENLAQFFW
jgi:hypothetical protein